MSWGRRGGSFHIHDDYNIIIMLILSMILLLLLLLLLLPILILIPIPIPILILIQVNWLRRQNTSVIGKHGGSTTFMMIAIEDNDNIHGDSCEDNEDSDQAFWHSCAQM